jgi:UDP-2,4-diacetamido-2,4,6-trideoxy-beta-L-altropyranose hydrolase
VTEVLIRAAGGSRLGFGHLRRCWTLAERLRASVIGVRFVATTEEGRTLLARAGFDVVVEPTESSFAVTTETLHAPGIARLVVVDDPEADQGTLASLRGAVPVTCFDDNGHRVLPVDLVVNGSAGAEQLVYRGASGTRFLLGPSYIVLREAFAGVPARPVAATTRRVLVLAGGADIGNITSRLLRIVLETLPEASVDVVTGPFAPSPSIDTLSPPQRARLRLHRAPDDMVGLMLAADMAVSGAGQTVYELAAAGTPTVGIRLAPDQALNLRGLAAAGTLDDVGTPTEDGFDARLATALATLAADAPRRAEMSRRGRALVDGRGAERVAGRIAGLMGALVA